MSSLPQPAAKLDSLRHLFGLPTDIDATGPAPDATETFPALEALPRPPLPIAPPAARIASVEPGAAAANPVSDAADRAIQAELARSQFGVTGAGIRIGILSDSFNVGGGYAADIRSGALPAGVTILKDGPASGNDEGRAMAQLVHSIAPGAQISFYTAFDGEADFAAGITALAKAGAQVIVDDVSYLDEPFFQDGGAVQQAVEQAVAGGASYFTAAGNAGTNYYQHAFQGIATPLPELSGSFLAQNFGTAAKPNVLQSLTIAQGSSVNIDLQWDQPFASIGAGHGSANSLGMVLYDAAGDIVGYAMKNATGANPDQILSFTNTTASTGFRLAIVTDGGSTVPGQFKYVVYGKGVQINDAAAGTGAGSLIGHAMVAEANTVGAVAWNATPAFGGNATAENFSGVGAGSILFDAGGNRLARPAIAGSVDFLAPDGTTTGVFAPFYGTSAAAPVAAATAALMLQENPGLSPAQVSAILARSTIAAGPAVAGGAGLIQASTAVQLAAITVARPGSPVLATSASLPAVQGAAGTTRSAAIADLSVGNALAGLRADPTSHGDFIVRIDPAALTALHDAGAAPALAMLNDHAGPVVPASVVAALFG